MNRNIFETMKDLLSRYIQSWIRQDKQMFLDTLSDKVDIRECYGASYTTKDEAEKWFSEWNNLGKVLTWEINDTYFDSEQEILFCTWEFNHHYPGYSPSLFDGITVLKIQDNKIFMLHEYETKHQRFYPYMYTV